MVLVTKLDEAFGTILELQRSVEETKAENCLLESKLRETKLDGRAALNDSFKLQDVITEERYTIEKENNIRVKPGCTSFQDWYNSFQVETAEDVGVVQVLESASMYSSAHSQSLRTDIRNCNSYNGGWGKREMLDGMADLLFTARRTFPGSKIIANSILYRADISNAALIDLNDQLQLMCWNFGVHLVKTWHFISRRHLARDGRHLSRYGNRCLGSLMLRSLMRVHGRNSELPAMNRPLKELSPENSQCVFPPLPPQSVTDSDSFLELSPNPPTLT
ncbi:hypothetical protein J6590_005829 [Homalodisca vitripennis]|nr:hypothetical protein J6590_005829 [Homalodisca vitripennis]